MQNVMNNEYQIIEGSGNVFKDLGFTPEESVKLQAEADLEIAQKRVKDQSYTTTEEKMLTGVQVWRLEDCQKLYAISDYYWECEEPKASGFKFKDIDLEFGNSIEGLDRGIGWFIIKYDNCESEIIWATDLPNLMNWLYNNIPSPIDYFKDFVPTPNFDGAGLS
jgi:hypothetical protein